MFVAGLASVMPATSWLETDFSSMNYRKDEYNAALSDFSLKGVLFARKFNDSEAYLNGIFELIVFYPHKAYYFALADRFDRDLYRVIYITYIKVLSL